MFLVNRTANAAAKRMPKVIGPSTHAALDYITAGTFLLVGALTWKRTKRASIAAFINGAAVLGASLLTDYPGGVKKVMSFKTHGKFDAAQATMAAAMPRVLGFRHKPIARFFELQAATETMVVGATDWDAMERRKRRWGWKRQRAA
jgi:hypothetical protein